MVFKSVYSSEIEVPSNCDLDRLAVKFLSQKPVGKLTQQRVKDSFALFLFHVRERKKKKVANGSLTKLGKVAFHVRHRRALLGKAEKDYIEFLEKENVLETNGTYAIGRSATRFKVQADYESGSWELYMVTDKTALKRIAALQQENEKAQKSLDDQVEFLILNLQEKKLSFHPDVYKTLEKLKADDIQLAGDAEAVLHAAEKYNIELNKIHQITSGTYKFQRDKKGERLHSSIGRLKKELRPYLLIDDLPCVEVDISNSQPFFMQVLTKPEFWTEEKLFSTKIHHSDVDKGMFLRLRDQSQYLQEAMHLIEGSKKLTTKWWARRRVRLGGREIEVEGGKRRGTILLLAVLVTSTVESSGLNFINLAQDGNLYEILSERFAGRYLYNNIDLLKDRESAKSTIIPELYGDPKVQQYYDKPWVLQELFPNFLLFTKLVKEFGPTNFALLVQRIEAKIFLEGAVKSFVEDHPNCGVITIHDSCLVPIKYGNILKNHIEEYVQSVVGLKPRVKMKEPPFLKEYKLKKLRKFTGRTAPVDLKTLRTLLHA